MIAEALAWPTRGPQWVSDRLALQGLVVAPVTAWRVLRRVGLNHRLARLAVLEDQSATRGLLTERTARRRRGRHVAAAQPGDLCSLDSFYIGKLKGVGKVWQLTACDCASSFGWARIVVGEVTAARMAAFLTDVVRNPERGLWTLRDLLNRGGALRLLYRTHLFTRESDAPLELMLEGAPKSSDAILGLLPDGDRSDLPLVAESLRIPVADAAPFLRRVVLNAPPPPGERISAANRDLIVRTLNKAARL